MNGATPAARNPVPEARPPLLLLDGLPHALPAHARERGLGGGDVARPRRRPRHPRQHRPRHHQLRRHRDREVLRRGGDLAKKELRSAVEARRSLTKFITIIVIAVALESLVMTFETGRTDITHAIYPAALFTAAMFALIALGAFQWLSSRIAPPPDGADVPEDAEIDHHATEDPAEAAEPPEPTRRRAQVGRNRRPAKG